MTERDYRNRWPDAVALQDAEYLGREMDAHVYKHRGTGEISHIGSAIIDSSRPVRHEGNPSRRGQWAGRLFGGGGKRG